jgi:hypothetical protein
MVEEDVVDKEIMIYDYDVFVDEYEEEVEQL